MKSKNRIALEADRAKRREELVGTGWDWLGSIKSLTHNGGWEALRGGNLKNREKPHISSTWTEKDGQAIY